MSKNVGIKIPKGNQIFSHYKEPLTKVIKGSGYYGAIIGSKDGKFIQCHICGKFYKSLCSHIFYEHKLRSRDYKIRFKLSTKTALVSEELRKTLKENLRNYILHLSPQERRKRKELFLKNSKKAAGNKGGKKLALEVFNKRGNCPDQLLDKIKQVSTIVGHTPTVTEFMRETNGQKYLWKIQAVFGSYKKALKKIKLPPPKGKKIPGYVRYTDEQLLNYLKEYFQINKIIPTGSDCRMGYIPTLDAYKYHFRTLQNARRLAGLPQTKFQ